jgi:hypothetical protein
MAKIQMEDYVEYPVLPADSIIHATITEVALKDVPGRDGRDGWTKCEVTFRIDGIQILGDGSTDITPYESLIDTKIWGSVPFRFVNSPENRLKQWVEAIFGMEVGVGFELDTDLFLGKKVRAITTTYDKKTTNPRTGQPFKAQQVSSLLKAGGQEPVLAGATAASTDPWANGGQWGASAPTEEPPF